MCKREGGGRRDKGGAREGGWGKGGGEEEEGRTEEKLGGAGGGERHGGTETESRRGEGRRDAGRILTHRKKYGKAPGLDFCGLGPGRVRGGGPATRVLDQGSR